MLIVVASSFVLEDLVIGKSILVKQRKFAAKGQLTAGVKLRDAQPLVDTEIPSNTWASTWSSRDLKQPELHDTKYMTKAKAKQRVNG